MDSTEKWIIGFAIGGFVLFLLFRNFGPSLATMRGWITTWMQRQPGNNNAPGVVWPFMKKWVLPLVGTAILFFVLFPIALHQFVRELGWIVLASGFYRGAAFLSIIGIGFLKHAHDPNNKRWAIWVGTLIIVAGLLIGTITGLSDHNRLRAKVEESNKETSTGIPAVQAAGTSAPTAGAPAKTPTAKLFEEAAARQLASGETANVAENTAVTRTSNRPEFTDLPERLPKVGYYKYTAPVKPPFARVNAFPVELMEKEGLTPEEMSCYQPQYGPALVGTAVTAFINGDERPSEDIITNPGDPRRYVFYNPPRSDNPPPKGPVEWWTIAAIGPEPLQFIQCWKLNKAKLAEKIAERNKRQSRKGPSLFARH